MFSFSWSLMDFCIHKAGALTHLWSPFGKPWNSLGWKWPLECLFPNLAQSSAGFYPRPGCSRFLVQFWKSPAMDCWLNIVVEHWNRLPQEVMESLSLEIFKTHLDMVLGNLLSLTLLKKRGWARRSWEIPANPNQSVILWGYTVSQRLCSHAPPLSWQNQVGIFQVGISLPSPCNCCFTSICHALLSSLAPHLYFPLLEI